MKRGMLLTALLALAATIGLATSPLWLDILFRHTDGKSYTVRSVLADSIATAAHTSQPDGKTDSLSIFTPGGDTISFALDSMERCELRPHIPTIYIVTDSDAYDVSSKSVYLTGKFSMSAGAGVDMDFDSVAPVSVNVRGRGNSTWGMPKKPYRLKFDKKISLCGMAKAKNYALIANYIDPTLMHNTCAFAVAEGMGMPYTNSSIAVDVMFNGRYCGSYMLTEKIGINAGSVDIDEEQGLLLEMDEAMDEDFCYYTPKLRLPVMVKDPDLAELAEADTVLSAQARFDSIRQQFNRAEEAIMSDDPDAWQQYFDLTSVVNYLLVQNVTGNWEFSHPKSLYVYRITPADKFHFGPVWDFDWTAEYFLFYDSHYDYAYPLLLSTVGSQMFLKMMRTEAFWDCYRQQWQHFKQRVWPGVKQYLDQYAELIETSALRNGELWHPYRDDKHRYYWESSSAFRSNYERYIKWIERRIEYIDQSPTMGLKW